MDAPRPSRRAAFWVALPAALAFVAFLPALSAGFTNWDDEVNFTNNLNYRGFTAQTLRWMFTDSVGHYIPLTWLTLALDYELWGMNPLGYHLTNLLWHAANAALCAVVLAALLRRARPDADERLLLASAAAGALFFAAHPLRAESVAWITERRDLTSGFFFLLALLAYLKAVDGDPSRPRRMLGVALCFAASLLCKTTGMMLPLFLLVIDLYPLRRRAPGSGGAASLRPLLVEKIPLFILMIAAIAGTRFTQGQANAMGGAEGYPPVFRLIEPGPRLTFYVAKTVWPVNLSPMYYFWPRLGPAHLAGGLTVLALTAAAWAGRLRWPAAAAAWAGFIVLIAPVSGVFQAGYHSTADRYSYLPCLPFAGLAAAALLAALSRRPAVATAAALAALAALGAMTWKQTAVWKTSVDLWTRAIEIDPHDPVALLNRGKALEERGDLVAARTDYTRGIDARPNWVKSLYLSRGTVALALGDLPAARADLSETIRLDPTKVKAWTSRAMVRELEGDLDGARADHDRAIELEPTYVQGLVNRGTFRSKRGDRDGALADAEAAIRAQPGHSMGYVFRAALRRAAGDLSGAKADLDRAVELLPPSVEALNNHGGMLLRAGKAREAAADYDRALSLQPDNLAVLIGRAQARRALGDAGGAADDLEHALRVAPPGWPMRPDFEAMLRSLRPAGAPR